MLEVVISSTILLVSVLAGASAQMDASRAMSEAQQTNIAVGVLQGAMDQVQDTRLLDVLTNTAGFAIGGEFAMPGPVLRDQRILVEAPNFIAGSSPHMLEIVLRLEFVSTTGRARQMVLAGLIR